MQSDLLTPRPPRERVVPPSEETTLDDGSNPELRQGTKVSSATSLPIHSLSCSSLSSPNSSAVSALSSSLPAIPLLISPFHYEYSHEAKNHRPDQPKRYPILQMINGEIDPRPNQCLCRNSSSSPLTAAPSLRVQRAARSSTSAAVKHCVCYSPVHQIGGDHRRSKVTPTNRRDPTVPGAYPGREIRSDLGGS
ncbi:hypothetical protein DY000_02045958 [Brassica cretica]|uniref:Uncharacterized protein n=1 Tax=Brassica cretica TaxID=69181 RepID=A0ABQ7F9J6_BRACR|nr:hypothetical protein DY000_02045958 [Brassica cretica]